MHTQGGNLLKTSPNSENNNNTRKDPQKTSFKVAWLNDKNSNINWNQQTPIVKMEVE